MVLRGVRLDAPLMPARPPHEVMHLGFPFLLQETLLFVASPQGQHVAGAEQTPMNKCTRVWSWVDSLPSLGLSFPTHTLGLAGPPRGLGRPGLTAYEHRADGEDLLGVSVGAHVAEAHAREAAQREVERSDVGAAPRRATRRAVDIGHLQPLAQLVQPA